MKIVLTVVVLMMMVNVSFAAPIKVTVTNDTTNVVLGEVIISDEEVKAIEYYVRDFAEWIIEAVKNKAILRVDAFVADHSDKNVKKLDKAQKKAEIKKINVQSRKEREANN